MAFDTKSIFTGFKSGLSIGRGIRAHALRQQLVSRGYDPITIDAAVEATKMGRRIDAILSAADRASEARERLDALRADPPKVFGSATWATTKNLVEGGYVASHEVGHGIALGHTGEGEPLTWNGESHLLTVAPTRTGKSTMAIIPNLLRYRGSAIVLDPKGELAAATAAWREAHVGPVYVLNPFGLAAAGERRHAFNPLDRVRDERDATKLAEMIYPRNGDDRQRFFDNEAIGFLSAVILFTARYSPPAYRTFGTIRDTLSGLQKEFYGLLRAMSDDAMPKAIQNAAKTVLTKTKDVGQPRLIDSLSQHLRIWDTPGLVEATVRTDFTFEGLKDAPATVYLVLPFDEITTYSTFVQMIFAAALDGMLANPAVPAIPVLFVLDEFLALDPDDRFVSALRTHASAGARLWFFLQDLATLEQKYPTTWKSFLQAEVKTFFGTDDPHTADLVSSYLGDTTVAYTVPNTNTSLGGGAGSYAVHENVQLGGRRLLTPPEVLRVLASHDPRGVRSAIHFLRGVPPVQATLSPWFLDPALRARGVNPHARHA